MINICMSHTIHRIVWIINSLYSSIVVITWNAFFPAHVVLMLLDNTVIKLSALERILWSHLTLPITIRIEQTWVFAADKILNVLSGKKTSHLIQRISCIRNYFIIKQTLDLGQIPGDGHVHAITQTKDDHRRRITVLIVKSAIQKHRLCSCITVYLNPLGSSAAYMRRQPRTSLVQIMTYRLFGAKALSELRLEYCQLDPWEEISIKF